MNKYTVSELTKHIKQIIEGNFRETVSVVGEVSNFSRASSGHIYFSLKESNCQIKVAFFKRYNIGSSVFIPKNGDKVQVIGDITLYEVDGSYQLIAKRILYDSVGDYWQKFEETKRKLESEGLFKDEIKKKLPLYPKRIALITSVEGAAIRDFIITKKNSNGIFDVEVWNVPVQGIEAKNKIVSAIINASKFIDRYDIIVVSRGGGSLEDLSVFNEEDIASAVFKSEIPVVSAIGHERDFTIIDFVADYRAATPTAAAFILSENYSKLVGYLEYLNERMIEKTIEYIQKLYQKIDYIEARINTLSPIVKLNHYRDKINILDNELKYAISKIINKNKEIINDYENMVKNYNPVIRINTLKFKNAEYLKTIKSIIFNKIDNYKYRIDSLTEKLNILNPNNILNRGYALVVKNDKIISSINDVNIKENIEIKMKDGYIDSFVIDIKEM